VKLSEAEEDDWHSSPPPLGVQSEDYTTCNSALEVCGIQSSDQVLDQHLIMLAAKEELAEHNATFLYVLKEMESSQKVHVFM
jgi:hypothetical protein